jgi:putative alpha-1,2-mannosidase
MLNGKPYENAWISYQDIMKGGTLTFTMGDQPNKSFGAASQNRPKTLE